MSERKVLNVSKYLQLIVLVFIQIISYTEILSPGFRSIENPSYEIVQKSSIHRTIDGSVQHAMQDLRWIHL